MSQNLMDYRWGYPDCHWVTKVCHWAMMDCHWVTKVCHWAMMDCH
jgi:hypothetical protein